MFTADIFCRKPIVYTTDDDRLFVALVGFPQNDPNWAVTVEHFLVAAEIAERDLRKLNLRRKLDRRGSFLTYAMGFSFGGGQKVCPFSLYYVRCLMSTSDLGFLSSPNR